MDDSTPYEYSTPGTPDSADYEESSDDNRVATRCYNLRSPRRVSTPSLHRRNGHPTPSSSRLTARPASIANSPLRRRDARSIKPTPPKPRRGGGRPRKGSSLVSENCIAKGSTRLLKDILGIVIWLVRKPLAWALAVVVLYVLASMAWIWLRGLIFAALSPLCALPGIGTIGLPFCEDHDSRWGGSKEWKGASGSAGRDFPKLINLQAHFEDVLENGVGGNVMALDLKKSEIAVRDLNSLVKHSKLVCRKDLSNRLEDFVAAAKSTSRQLSKFSSRIGGVVDNLLAMDEYAIRTLENVQAAQIAAPKGFKSIIAPFWGRYDVAAAEREILTTFVQAYSVMDTSIQRLIQEAEIALQELNDLESKLSIIGDIVERENSILNERNQEVLAQIWTTLGGNRGKLANFESHKYLLLNISVYRKRALTLVSKSLLQLQKMQSDLEELRDRVAEPALLENAGGEEVEKIPLEVHIRSIRKGVDRLSEGMSRAKGREQRYMKAMLAGHDEAGRTEHRNN